MANRLLHLFGIGIMMVAFAGCKKQETKNTDISFAPAKLSGIYIMQDAVTAGRYCYIRHFDNSVMRQATNHLFGEVSLNDIKEFSYIQPYTPPGGSPSELKPSTTKMKATMLYHEGPGFTRYVWYVYQLAGTWHISSKNAGTGISYDISSNPDYWFYVHLYGPGDGGRERVVIESAGRPGECLANEGHYSTGTNYPRFFKLTTQAEIDAFQKWEIAQP
ncbi:MAG TPA: hypothetical protein PKC39_12555 [Ferruginibacter sp.]|nr:hypothetical protein [Ferruginibacter sp.]HMP21782.1 hypothetical protein [Ferruginibacter sp.]